MATEVPPGPTLDMNRLWKLLRYASPDLYLLLGGKNGEIGQRGKVLKNQGILSLLMSKPDIGEWKRLSETGMLEAMGGGRYKGRRELIEDLRKVGGELSRAFPGDGVDDQGQCPSD